MDDHSPPGPEKHRRFERYGIAALAVVAAAVLRLALAPIVGNGLAFITFVPAVMVAAWLGGFWPAIVSTGLSAAIVEYAWFEPVRTFNIANGTALVIFAAACIAISALGERLRRGQTREFESRDRAEQAQQDLRQHLEDVTRMQHVSTRLLQAGDVSELLPDILDTAIEITDADMGNIQLLDGDALQIVEQRGFEPAFLEFFDSVHSEQAACGTALVRGERVIVEDVVSDPIFVGTPALNVMLTAGARAVQSTPLVSRTGRILGMFSTHYRRAPQRPSERALRLLDILARQAADLIEHRQAEAALRAKEAELELVVNETPFMLIRCTRELRYKFISRTYAEMIGRRPDDVIGRRIVDVMGVTGFETIRPYVERVLQGTRVEYEATVPYEGIGARFLRATYTPDRDDRGRVVGWVASLLDVTDRKRADETRALWASIVDSSDDAIISQDVDGIITSWNAAAERTFGYTAAEAIGQPITLIVPPERGDEETDLMPRLRKRDSIEHFETERLTRDGRRIAMSIAISPMRHRDGVILGASEIARDITDRARADEERKQLLASEHAARTHAEAASRAKDEFLATVSHELRTPLNAILGWAAMLERGASVDGRALKGLQSIYRNTRALAQLVDDLLDVSRMISGKMRLDVVPMDVGDVIDAAVEAILPAASAKDIAIETAIDPAARTMVGDAARLQQAVWNLLSNAVKFTPSGGRIHVQVGAAEGEIELVVSDTGIGIEEGFLPYVFDRFRQADASTTRAHSGLGLGLAIVRHLVELHGGRVRAESAGRNAGSRFTIRLPRKITPSIAREARKTMAEPVALASSGTLQLGGLRILIVDDDDESLEMMQEALERYGAAVQATMSASDAIDVLPVLKPDLVLSDLAMPGQDGFTVLRAVRGLEDAFGRRVPVMAVTAYAGAEDRRRAMTAGFDAYMPKPVEPAALAQAVAKLVVAGHP